MALSKELVSEFAKLATAKKEAKTETVVQGTVTYDGKLYVKLDGSDMLTPVETTIDVADGDRVNVTIKDHAATITGSTSSPAAKQETVVKVSDKTNKNASQISEFEIIIAYKVTADDVNAVNANIDNLIAKTAKITELAAVTADLETLRAKIVNAESLTANDLKAINAEIDKLTADIIEATGITTEQLNADYAEINDLKAYVADFTYVSADVLDALKANINDLTTKKLDVDFANIEYAKVNVANIYELFTQIGLMEELTAAEGTFTHMLTGVKILADLIEAGTLKADRLIVKGQNGLYYQLNLNSDGFAEGEEIPVEGIHGKVIIADSITADKISVTDLFALGATIGGFKIDLDAIHSIGKDSVDNDTRGTFLDNEGQIALGDSKNYIKYRKVVTYHAINVNSDSGEYVANADKVEYDEALIESSTLLEGVYTTENDNVYAYTEADGVVGYFCKRETYKLQIVADRIRFTSDGMSTNDEGEGTAIDEDSVETDIVTINNELRQKDITEEEPGEWVWATRTNGNYGLMWREGE